MHDDPLVGATLADRYRVESVLGRGGMGAVYRARDAVSGATVALKVVLPGRDAPRLVPRIIREARLASRLHHPHVVSVLDQGRWGHDRRHAYLAMELVEGVTLSRLVGPPMDPGLACALASQLLSALAHVHARGVLHRDVKPDNVLVSRDADGALQARLADFGIAGAIEDESSALTRLTAEGSVLGTPLYMAPEQIEGRSRLGPGADLYAVGLILYELLEGTVPFDGPYSRMVLDKLSRDPPPPTAELPGGLEEVLMRLLARRPQDRYPLAATALGALAPFVGPARLDEEAWPGAPARPARSTSTTARTLGAPSDALFGRDAELAAVDGWASQAEGGEGLVALVTGDPGVGKSALVEAAAVALNEAGRFFVLRGRLPPGAEVTGALANALEDWLGTHGRDRAAVEAALRDALGASGDEEAALLALLRPDASAPALDVQRAGATFVRALRRIAADRPAMVVLEGLAPDASVAALVELLLYELELSPLPCLVALPLPKLRPTDPLHATLARTASAEGQGRRVLALAPLAQEALAEMLERAHGLPPHRAARIARRAEGNPLFAIHLCGVGSLDSVDALAQTVASGSEEEGLPPALRGLLEASLVERLGSVGDEAAARVLERAAVLGDRVELSLLEELTDPADRPRLDDLLDALIDVELLSDAGVDEVAFAHRLLREVVLARLSPRRLRRLHARAAGIRRDRGRPEDAGAIGDHLAAAGQTEDAAEAWLDAYRRAQDRGEGSAAIERGQQALAALPADDPRRGELALGVAWALRRSARLDEAAALAEPLAGGDDTDLALLASEVLAEIAQERVDIAGMRAVVERAEGRLDAASQRGRAAFFRAAAFHANFTAAPDRIALATKALELSTEPLARLTAARRLTFAAVDPETLRLALSVADEVEDRVELRVDVEQLRAFAEMQLGDDASATARLQWVVDELRRAGRMANRVAATVNLSGRLLMSDRPEEAEPLALEALALAERFSLRLEFWRALGNLVAIEVEMGHPERALARYEEASARGDRDAGLAGRGILRLLVSAASRDREGAEEALEQVDLPRIPPVAFFSYILWLTATHLEAAGLAEAARQLLLEVRARREQRGIHLRDDEVDARLAALGEPAR